MKSPFPRCVISALKGSSGKTLFSVGIIRAWKKKGIRVRPFKKGPDYIDAEWLASAGAASCHNLDLFIMSREESRGSFVRVASGGDVSVVEGNRGLFDGVDPSGSYSTAELAKLLDAPVVLIIDCTKMTGTAAAIVKGVQQFDPEVNVAAVILNNVAGKRHETVIKEAINQCCNIPIVGSIPKLKDVPLFERHLGLSPQQECPETEHVLDIASELAQKYIDLDQLLEICRSAPSLSSAHPKESEGIYDSVLTPSIGVIRDSAFHFYYPENLDELQRLGAEIIEINALEQETLPEVDLLYIGGGFPEVQAEKLADNKSLREAIKRQVEKGMPVYAECGGTIYLGKTIVWEGKEYPMVGVFPFEFHFEKKPVGHGYTVLEVTGDNPYFPRGLEIRGHEFRYSRIVNWEEGLFPMAFAVKKGFGINGKEDGLCYKNVLATYTHIHALGTREWAKAIFDRANELIKVSNQA